MQGWDVTRLWLWLLGGALLVLVGLQLVISWVLMRVLEELSVREARIADDMAGGPAREGWPRDRPSPPAPSGKLGEGVASAASRA